MWKNWISCAIKIRCKGVGRVRCDNNYVAWLLFHLSLSTSWRLMDHDSWVRQWSSLSLGARWEKESAHWCGHAETNSVYITWNVLHGVKDCKPCLHWPSRTTAIDKSKRFDSLAVVVIVCCETAMIGFKVFWYCSFWGRFLNKYCNTESDSIGCGSKEYWIMDHFLHRENSLVSILLRKLLTY